MRTETGFAVIVILLFAIIAVPLLAVAGFTGSAVSELNLRTEANMFSLGLLGFILILGFIFLMLKYRTPDFSTTKHRPRMLYNPSSDTERIADYIEYAKSKRMTKAQIKRNLSHAGWEDDVIGKAFKSFEEK